MLGSCCGLFRSRALQAFARQALRRIAISCVASCFICSVVCAQSPPEPLDPAAMRDELARLKKVCDEIGLKNESTLCGNWLPAERDDQLLLFLPEPTRAASASDAKQAAWVKHFEAARGRHAEYWFAEFKKAIEANDEVRAYRLLWRTLRENAQHAEAKRTLGRLATSTLVRPVVRRSNSKHPLFNWPANSYTRVESPHFYLTSRAGTAETIAVAIKLEEFYSLWTQYFFPLWAPPGLLKKRFEVARHLLKRSVRSRSSCCAIERITSRP